MSDAGYGEITNNHYGDLEDYFYYGDGDDNVSVLNNNETAYDPSAFPPLEFTNDYLIYGDPVPPAGPSDDENTGKWVLPLIFWGIVIGLGITGVILRKKDILVIDENNKLSFRKSPKKEQ